MTPPSNQGEAIDHRERSREWLEQAELRRDENEAEAETDLHFANAHASLAIAEELRGVRDSLAGRVEGRYRDALEEIAGLTLDEEQPDNRVRSDVYTLAAEALEEAS